MMDAIEKPGGVFGPSEQPPEWREMALAEFVENGLLYEVNRKVLWDLGLALTVQTEGAGNSTRYMRLYVTETVPPHRIISIPTDPVDVSRWERLQRWLSTRYGRIRG